MPKKKFKKNDKPVQVMTEFKLSEISAVTRPAQGGALAVIMKRGDSDDIDPMAKAGDLVDLLTSSTSGHQHGIIVDMDGDHKYILVQYAHGKNEETSHDHQLVIDSDGAVTVSENNGHTHTIEAEALREVLFSQIVNKNNEDNHTIEFTNAADKGGLIAKETTMPAPTVSQEEHDKVVKQLALVTALTAMSEIHKSHYNTLDATGKEGFIAKSVEDRELDIKLQKSADPVVYTTDSIEVKKESTIYPFTT